MKLIFLLIIFISGTAQAREDMDVWSEGIHLYAGGGVNTSLYHSNSDTLGTGLHFKTDFGYSIRKQWAIEAGSFVKFTKVHDTLIWDTLLTIGVRKRLDDDYYLRLFIGQAPTVFFGNKTPDIYRRSETTRSIYNGPAFGLSVGKIYKTWFWETTGSYQALNKGKGIKDEDGAPEETFRSDLNGLKIISLTFTIGIQVF